MQSTVENAGLARMAKASGLNGSHSAAPRETINVVARTPNGATVNLVEFLRERCSHLPPFFAARLEFHAPDAAACEVHSETAILISLIVKEAVVNAIQYSHPAGVPGIIGVACQGNRDGSLAIDIVDDGVGLPGEFRSCDGWRPRLAADPRLERQAGRRVDIRIQQASGFAFICKYRGARSNRAAAR